MPFGVSIGKAAALEKEKITELRGGCAVIYGSGGNQGKENPEKTLRNPPADPSPGGERGQGVSWVVIAGAGIPAALPGRSARGTRGCSLP